ncbi:MAG: hypothetical protein MUF18_12105, partial [Fimbriiglobus sp.]|nr:hypothetical protein [Fimbriiglobus sp.]
DFITTRRQITLVPPPTLVDLYRDEFQPAYLHYAAPIPETGGPADTLYTLRGRMVRLAPKKIGLSSDKAVFAVPAGTELHITAEADKDLKLVELRAIGPNPLVVPEFLRAEAKKETRDDRGVIVAEEFADMPIARPVGANEARLELDRGSATGLRVGEVEFGAEKLGVRRFTLKFEGKRAIRQLDKPTEFQIDMTDSDGVKSTRTIAITAADDAPPQVEVLIDPVVRRVAGAYMVTPVARVPFLADSKVWDTEGLSAVRFEFRKTAEESPSVVALRAIAAAAVTANTFAPISSWALPATVVHSQTQFDLFFGGTIPAQADPNGLARLPGVLVDRFGADAAAIQRLTATQLDEVTVPRDGGEWADQLVRAELARQQVKVDGMKPADLAAARATVLAAWKARPAPELKPDRGPPAVKTIKLSDARGDAFDLQRFMPELLMKATDTVQQRYKVDLFVTAKDVNVELTGKDGKPTDPRSARNLDPIRLMVVSEQDLLVEIGKDEETQGQRMEDAVGLATATKSKLDVEFNLLRSLPPPNTKERTDQLASTQVRVTGFGQELSKVRELLTGMRTEYEKLYREMDVNRVSAPSLYKYRNEADKAEDNKTGYLDLLAQLLDDNRAMAKLEKSLEAVRGTLAAQQAPADGAMTQTTADYLVFLRLLNKLRDQIGTGNDKNKLLADLKRITDVQRNEIRTGIKAALDDAINRVRRPDVVLPRDITRVAAGKSAKIKIGVRWKLYPEKSIFLGLEVPKATELKFNPEDGVSVKDDGNDVTVVEVEVTAGAKAGVHTVTLRPGTFKPVELQIEVTK